MLISFFLQKVSQTNQNHYRASKTCSKLATSCEKNLQKQPFEFLKIAVPKKLPKSLNNNCEKVDFW